MMNSRRLILTPQGSGRISVLGQIDPLKGRISASDVPADVRYGSWPCKSLNARRERRMVRHDCAFSESNLAAQAFMLSSWRIVFSTFCKCMSFHTWGNSGIEPYSGFGNQLSRNVWGPPHVGLAAMESGDGALCRTG